MWSVGVEARAIIDFPGRDRSSAHRSLPAARGPHRNAHGAHPDDDADHFSERLFCPGGGAFLLCCGEAITERATAAIARSLAQLT
jgi:hypothetical protein